MAKRYTDTDKWKKKWFRELGATLRDTRQFILDQCTHFGVWEVDFDTVKHFTGHKATLEDVQKAFQGKVYEFEKDKLFIPAFILFQYGELREDSRPHQSVIKELKNAKLWEIYLDFAQNDSVDSQTLSIGLAKGYLTLKDKDKDKEQVQEKEKDTAAVLKTDAKTAEFLSKVKTEVQTQWLAIYPDKNWVEREIQAAVLWCLAKPTRAPKSDFAAFFTSWLKRGWEDHRRKPTPAAIRTPPKPDQALKIDLTHETPEAAREIANENREASLAKVRELMGQVGLVRNQGAS